MKDRKRRLELYSFYDHTGIERHLERMAEKGWMLEKVENNIWHYRRIKPEKLTFFVTYFPRASELDPEPGEEQKIFFDFCEHTGWKLAAVSAQQQIFYNESPDPVPIATDPQVELETVRRSARKSFLPGIWVLLACGLAVTVMSAIRLRQDPIGALSSAAWLFSSLAWLLVILYGASELAGYFAWCHGAKKAAARGEFLETSSRVWLGKVILAVTLAGLLYCLANMGMTGPGWQRLVSVGTVCGILGIFAIGWWLKGFLKRRKLKPGANRTLTFLFIFAAYLAFVGLMVYAGLKLAEREIEKSRGAAAGGYYQELPLSVEDLLEVQPEFYETMTTEDRSPLLGCLEVNQMPDWEVAEARTYPYLQYTIVDVKAPFLYEICKEQLFKERDQSEDGSVPERHKRIYEPCDLKSWGAEEAWTLRSQDAGWEANVYLLCYPDRIVEIWFGWELSEEQMRTAGEMLAS